MTKTIGYLAMVAGAILMVVGLGLIVRQSTLPAIIISLGAIVVGSGWYIAKKQPTLPGD